MQRVPEKIPGIVIVGAGPVGSMLALMLNTLLPDQPIDVFEKRHGDVRGHGLDIHKETISEMSALLDQAEQSIKLQLKTTLNNRQEINRGRRYYLSVMQKIARVKTFLKNEVAGKFIRTGKISEMAQDLAKELGSDQVRFHLDTELTGHDIQTLTQPEILDEDQAFKQRILQSAKYIFAADGSHSGIRASIFNESTADLRKNVLSYLLEIKLDMCDKQHINKTLDVLQRQVLPTLKSGKLHIWNQSADGTATLHVFINKHTYDTLHVQDENGRFKGEFAYPYRRLIDLPSSVSGFIRRLIVDVIDENKMDASTIKVTVLPLQVYVARKMLTTCNNKTIALSGDAGVGLALARGVNNGFYSAARYALALFQERMIDELTPDIQADFAKYSAFWNEQQAHLEAIIFFLDEIRPVRIVAPANRQAAILDEYDKIFESMFKAKNLSMNVYARKIQSQRDHFLRTLISRDDVKDIDSESRLQLTKLITTLFTNLVNQDLMCQLLQPELFKCQRDISLRANRKIADAKFEVRLIEKTAKVHDTVSKSISDLDDAPHMPSVSSLPESPLAAELAQLHLVLTQLGLLQHPHYSQWVFQLDLMYLSLARKVHHMPIEFLRLVTAYVADMPVFGQAASRRFSEDAPRFLEKTLVDKIVATGNYLFNCVRRSVVQMEREVLIKRALQGVLNYVNANGDHLNWPKRLVDGSTGQARAEGYRSILASNEDPLIKLAVIYALFNHASAPHLRMAVLNAMLDPEHHDLLLELPVTEQESQVMLEVLQNRLAADLGTKKLRVLKKQALAIVQGIDNKKLPAVNAVTQFKDMVIDLTQLRSREERQIIEICIAAASQYFTNLRQIHKFDQDKNFSKESSVGKMSMFKPENITDPKYLLLLKDEYVSLKFRLAVISALLASKKISPTLTSLITEQLVGKDHRLSLNQITEVIDSHLTGGMNKEQLAAYKSRLFKLMSAINDKADLLNFERPLMDLLASVNEGMQLSAAHPH